GVLRTIRSVRDWDAAAIDETAPLSQALVRARRLLLPGMRLFLVSDGFNVDAEALRLLPQIVHRHETALVLLGDPLERAPPPAGQYAFRTQAGVQAIDFGTAAVRDEWPRRFADARAEFVATCRKLGVRIVELDAGADLRRAL